MTAPDIHNKVASLSQGQRTYLQFVASGLTSKEIAKAVGGSHHTINAEIGIAMRVLGAKSRQAAAAILVEAAGDGSYERSCEPGGIVSPPPATAGGGRDEGIGAGEWALPFPTERRPVNTMTVRQRIGWILALATIVALLLGGLASGVTALLESSSRWL